MKKELLIIYVSFFVTAGVTFAAIDDAHREKVSEEGVETFVYIPPDIENICIWVPADKVGPLINRACRAKGSTYSKSLPADVQHSKDVYCPFIIARLLAQTVSVLHESVLPLTIFNGWQWEYSYSMAEYDAKAYDLPARGGSWENCYEAIYVKSYGEILSHWIAPETKSDVYFNGDSKSNIIVETFINMRTRDGYPKQRQLD